MKAQLLPSSPRVKFKTTHSLYPSEMEFDSWIELVDYTLDLAIKHVEDDFTRQVDILSQEMLDSVVELPCL